MRLDKMLAHLGYGSRKEVKKIIRAGWVLVNDELVRDDDFHVSEADSVVVYDENVEMLTEQYFLMNKPAGTICSHDNKLFPSVYDLFDEQLLPKTQAFGRLDQDTQGVLILSSDGVLGHRLLSPKHHVKKVYQVDLLNSFDPKFISLIEKGIKIDKEEICAPATIEIVSDKRILLTLVEGKYHQVKRMMVACENEVTNLIRIQFGPIMLDPKLEPGQYRKLSEEEIELLRNHA
ncbi:MAG TPA: rRNA pseudouridine synthase [Erysipelotrichaceae bacterium]|nr:rRNA pseudouridine synthase [Erysipelotrichaceae bacterium]